MTNPHPLAGLHRENPDMARARRGAQFEEKLVGHILSKHRLSQAKTKMHRVQYKLQANRRLTLSSFIGVFPDFPVYLFAAEVPFAYRESSVDKLFSRFSTRPYVKTLFDLVSDLPDEVANNYHVGLCFPMKGVTRGLVLHDYATGITEKVENYKKPTVRMVWSISGGDTDAYVLEPFDQFLGSIDPKWVHHEF